MPPKRKSSANCDGSDAEGPHPGADANEDESTAPKKRGRKSLINTILEEEARGTPAPALPQNQWSVSLIQPPNLLPTTNPPKRRKTQPTASSLVNQKHPSPGTPSIWGTNKGIFCSAFRSLTESFGGICFANIGTFPVLAWLIEGPRWPEDIMDGDTLYLSLVTEFRPKDQLSASTSANPEKKKGGQKRRTKREGLSTIPTALGDAANANVSHDTHVELVSLSQESQPVPKERWPCLVRSPIYNPEYPTFCECLQPHCSYHCPTARSILSRGCTTYSWPAPGVIRNSGWPLLAESYMNLDSGVEARHRGGLIGDSDASAEHRPRVQARDNASPVSVPVLPSRLPLDTAKECAQVVPELASLLDHMKRKSPVLVISTTDAGMESFLPFQLPSEYGCVVLGFFDIQSVECESENSFPAPSVQPGKLSWRVRLRYTPPSDAKDSNGNLTPPWWLASPNISETSDVAAPAASAPVLGSEKSIVEVEASESGEAPASADLRWCIIQALDGNPRRSWWHCSGCGRINQRDMLVHRRCPSCQRNESPAPPFIIEDVLQDASTAPYPCNHAPLSMKKDDILVKEFHDMTSVYCYNFRDESLSVETTVDSSSDEGACVKHIFTGPYENLKVQATRLFLQIQEGVELSWQGVATGIAEGQYYSWASPRHGWVDKEIPQCISQVRKLISKFVSDYGDKDPGEESHLGGMLCEGLSTDPQPSTSSHATKEEDEKITENVRINHIIALAWTASGSKRGAFVSAKDGPVFLLSLGANVELELERCSPDPPEPAVTENSEPNLPVSQGVPAPGPGDCGAGQKTTGGKKQRKSKKNLDQDPVPENNANLEGKKKGKGKGKAAIAKPPGEKPKQKPKPTAPPHERLKVSMVHGDVLILSGGDYIYTLTRTGMSILLFALPDAQY